MALQTAMLLLLQAQAGRCASRMVAVSVRLSC